MSDTSVIVVGGGIGGLSAAIALRRAGFEAAVFERAPELREVGAAISVWPNATRLLKRWGVLDDVRRRGTTLAVAEMRGWRGNVLHRTRLPERDAPHVLIHRAELHAALAGALPPWAVHTGAEFQSFTEAGRAVRARFAGLGEVEGAALVGADGLRSAVRAQVLGDGPPVYRGYPVWRGVAEGDFGWDPRVIAEALGPGQRVGIAPLGGGRMAWWATANEPEGADDGPEGRKAKLLRLFGGWHAPIPQMMEATPDEAILKNDTYDRPPVRGWGRGRVTLLGDAAHPTTPNLGQGGCMAMEDAEVLAACLAAGADVAAALREFERRRYGRTRAVTLQSLRYGRIAQWSNPLLVGVRDLLYRLTPGAVSTAVMGKMFAYEV